MSVNSLTGQDTVILNDRTLFDLADGDAGALTFPNNIAEIKTGKNKNAIYANNENGQQCELLLRVIMGSSGQFYR